MLSMLLCVLTPSALNVAALRMHEACIRMHKLPSMPPVHGMFHAHGCNIQPAPSMPYMRKISPFPSVFCDTSTSRSALCTSRASYPDTHYSAGCNMHHANVQKCSPRTESDGTYNCSKPHVTNRNMQHIYIYVLLCSNK